MLNVRIIKIQLKILMCAAVLHTIHAAEAKYEASNTDIITELQELMKDVKGLTSKIARIESNVSRMKKSIDNNSKDITDIKKKFVLPSIPPTTRATSSSGKVFYPPGTKTHSLPRCYPLQNLCFVGYGTARSHHLGSEFVISFQVCMNKCMDLRKQDKLWNGVVYDWDTKECQCHYDDKGHVNNHKKLHYHCSD